MSKRLNQERENKLQPKRINKAIKELESRGFKVNSDETRIDFLYNGNTIMFFPYSGWASGRTIKDGRGLKRLLNQLDGG